MKLSSLLALSLCLVGSIHSQAQPAQPPVAPQDKAASIAPKSVRLTVMPREGMKQTAPDSGKYECGQIDLLQTQRVERTFTLKNETNAPVALDAVRTSCGCQSSVILKNGQTVPQTVLAPGEQVDVRLSVSVSRAAGKEKRVSAWAHNRGQVAPLAAMEMSLQLEPPVQFQPAVLTFHQAGESQTVTVRADARLVGAGAMPSLSGGKGVFEAELIGMPRRLTEKGRSWVEAVYRVKFTANSSASFQTAALSLLPPETAKNATKAEKEIRQLWQQLAPTLPITTDIKVGLRCLPESLAFGYVSKGASATRRILIFATNKEELSGLRIAFTPAWLKLTLLDTGKPRATAQGFIVTLEASLLPEIRTGLQQASLSLQNAQGKTLLIPVLVQVAK